MDNKVRPLQEDFVRLGFSDRTPGGAEAFRSMLGLMGVEVTPLEEAKADPGAEAGQDPIDGPVMTEEALELVGAILAQELIEGVDAGADLEEMDEADLVRMRDAIDLRISDLEEVYAEMEDKEVPKALEERTQAVAGQVLAELKMLRIVGGKVKRVLKRIGSAAIKAHRKAKIFYKTHKAKIKMRRKKKARTAKTKLMAAKTARKHASMGDKLKKIAKRTSAGVKPSLSKVRKAAGRSTGLVKHESAMAARLAALLDEGTAGTRSEGQVQRDDIVECVGRVIDLVEWLVDDVDVSSVLVAEYDRLAEEFCGGKLNEGAMEEEAFHARIVPFLRAIGVCVEEFEKKLGRA